MATAVEIMERRVNGLGVSEAEVQTQGDRNIIVNIPKGTNSKEAREQVGTTAKLYFRPVLATDVAGGATTPTPSPTGSPTGKATDKAEDKDRTGRRRPRRPPPPRPSRRRAPPRRGAPRARP